MAGKQKRVVDAEIVREDGKRPKTPTKPQIDDTDDAGDTLYIEDVPAIFRSLVETGVVGGEIAELLSDPEEVDPFQHVIELSWGQQPAPIKNAIGFFYPDLLRGIVAKYGCVNQLLSVVIQRQSTNQRPLYFTMLIPSEVAEQVMPAGAGEGGMFGLAELDPATLKGVDPLAAQLLKMMMIQHRETMTVLKSLGTAENKVALERIRGFEDMAHEMMRATFEDAMNGAKRRRDPAAETEAQIKHLTDLMRAAKDLPNQLAEFAPTGKGFFREAREFIREDGAKIVRGVRSIARGDGLPAPVNNGHRQRVRNMGGMEPPGKTPSLFQAPKHRKVQ